MGTTSSAGYCRPGRKIKNRYPLADFCIWDAGSVVNPLYTESPLETVDGIVVPTAEKVLVDIVANPEFFYLQGSEANTIYSNVLRDCYISIPRLKRYARRRRCIDKVQKRLDNIDQPYND